MSFRSRISSLTLAVASVVALAPGAAARAPAAEPGPHLAALLSSVDRSVDPCQDFYRYACGGWLQETELPGDQSRWSRSFSEIRERNRESIRTMLEDAAEAPGPAGTDRHRIGVFYGACMDEAAIEKAGAAPLASWQKKIGEVETRADALRVAGELVRIGGDSFFDVSVFGDFEQPDLNIAHFAQGGLGLPDREYYLSHDEKKREILAAYESHVARMLELAGVAADEASARAAAVVAFETRLAEASRPAPEMRIPERLYHRIDLEGLQRLAPDVDWQAWLDATGHPGIRQINVMTPEFFAALNERMEEASPQLLRDYLTWELVDTTARLLPARFVEADFDFYEGTLSGTQEMEPRWKRCVDATEGALGEVVGRLYVDQHFAGDSKEKALAILADIDAAFSAALPELAWMDDATRQRALEKMEAVGDKIGYPDEWRDYSGLELHREAGYFANATAATEHEVHRQASKVGEPVDPNEWRMTPQTVNAYYNPLQNEIVFPAGILQPPFFHRDAPPPMNYGAMGVVVGHELTHGFDDSGRKFDPSGQLREWWEPAVAERFEERAQCVRDLYSSYEVEPGVTVQGDLTAGENIADIGGLKQAYLAYRLWEERQEEQPRFSDELTNDQLFFVSFAQVWCTEYTPEELRRRVTVDPHSPAEFRVKGPITNNPFFAEAFQCAEGTPMNPVTQCEVW